MAPTTEELRAMLRKAARLIEDGKPLTRPGGKSLEGINRFIIASALEEVANLIPDRPKKRPGQARRFDHVDVQLRYWLRSDTRQQLAERHGVSVTAINKILRGVKKVPVRARRTVEIVGSDRQPKARK